MQRLIRIAMVLILCATVIMDSAADPSDTHASQKDMQWWKDAKFGLFFHWSPVCIVGHEISWSRGAPRVGVPKIFDYPGYLGEVPVEVYDNLYKIFDPAWYNAKEWVAMAKAAGMKYVVAGTRHHDGFSMFDTKLDDYKITNTPFRRDTTKELADACHESGMKLGFYYSQVNWHHPDWNAQNLEKYREYMFGQVRELLTNYGKVDIMWFDGVCGDPEIWQSQKLVKMVRELQPGILVNDRSGEASLADFVTPEQKLGEFNIDHAWESCITIGGVWAWRLNEDVKPPEECIENLVRTTGGGGNLLFNLGPMPTGQFEQRQIDAVLKVGEFLKANGESIYGTTGGPYKPSVWMVSTRKGNTIYVHILDWRGGDTVYLSPIEKKIVSSSLLSGGQVEVQQTKTEVTVRVPKSDQKRVDTIVALNLDGPASDISPRICGPSKSVAFKKKAAASSVLNNDKQYGADKAFDDDYNTWWGAAPSKDGTWSLEADLGKPTDIGQAFMSEWNQSYYSYGIRKFELQYRNSDDGQWKTFYEGARVGPKLTVQFDPVSARHVRLHILQKDPTYTEDPGIYEFQLFAPNKQR